MDIYIINSADGRKAAKDVKRFKLEKAKLLLFREPDTVAEWEDMLREAFLSMDVYECPGNEHTIMMDTIKNTAAPDDTLYLIGPALTDFYSKFRNQLVDTVRFVYVSKTLNTEGKHPAGKKRKKQWENVQKAETGDVLSELLDLGSRSLPTEAKKAEESGTGTGVKHDQFKVDRHSTKADSGQQKKEIFRSRSSVRPLDKEQKDRKRVLESAARDKEYENNYSPVENAKGDLCACILDRLYRHIVDLCFPGSKGAQPVRPEDTVPFVIMLLRSYAKSLEGEKEAVGEYAAASDLDYGRIYAATIELFEKSWASTHSVIKITKDVLSVLLPEAQFYWRLTKILYEEDQWENI